MNHSFSPSFLRLLDAIYRLRKLSTSTALSLSFDCHILKELCIKLPALHLANDVSAAPKRITPQEKIYQKWITSECAPMDRLCKVLSSPTESLLPILMAMSSSTTPDVEEISRIFSIRGVSAKDQQQLIDAYNSTVKSAEAKIPTKKSDLRSVLDFKLK